MCSLIEASANRDRTRCQFDQRRTVVLASDLLLRLVLSSVGCRVACGPRFRRERGLSPGGLHAADDTLPTGSILVRHLRPGPLHVSEDACRSQGRVAAPPAGGGCPRGRRVLAKSAPVLGLRDQAKRKARSTLRLFQVRQLSQAVASHPATRHGSSASKDRDSPGCIGLTLDGEHRDGAAGAWCSASGSCPQAQAAPRLLASASYHWSVRRPQAPSASSVITTSPGRGAAWGCQLPSRPRRASSLAPPSHHDDAGSYAGVSADLPCQWLRASPMYIVCA